MGLPSTFRITKGLGRMPIPVPFNHSVLLVMVPVPQSCIFQGIHSSSIAASYSKHIGLSVDRAYCPVSDLCPLFLHAESQKANFFRSCLFAYGLADAASIILASPQVFLSSGVILLLYTFSATSASLASLGFKTFQYL